jgi:signal transduction histidine kinase
MSLIDNAVKYSPGGEEVTIAVEGDPTHELLTLSVADNSLGLSEEDQGRLVTTFHRVKRDETMDIPGTGLGLYVAKMVVERMGGWMSVSSVLDQGSTFTVTLPLMRAEELAA